MRTKKNIVDYFPHEANPSDNDALTIIDNLFGNDGYAFWYKLQEKLARTENHFINIHKDSKWQLFCSQSHITPEKAITIVEKMVELDAIDADLWQDGIIWSESLVYDLEPVYKNRRRELPQKPVYNNSYPLTTNSNVISTSKKAITTSQSRVEYSRVEKSREDKEASFKKYTDDLRLKYNDLDFENELEKFNLYWEEGNRKLKRPRLALKNWMDKARQIRSDRDNGAHKQKPGAVPTQYTRPEEFTT